MLGQGGGAGGYFYTLKGVYKFTRITPEENIVTWATLNVCPVHCGDRPGSAVQCSMQSCSAQTNNPMFPLHLLQFVNNPLLGTAEVKLRPTAARSDLGVTE